MVLKLVELVVAPRGTVYEKRKLRVALNLCAPTKPPSRETRLYVSPLRGPHARATPHRPPRIAARLPRVADSIHASDAHAFSEPAKRVPPRMVG